tara:strand:- start:2513 stop:2986 length:474 start_codon:yes stop_codon:yes gene_type:complete
MAVTIDGTGSITGLSVGWPPDNSIVDTDIVSVSTAKLSGTIPLANFPALLSQTICKAGFDWEIIETTTTAVAGKSYLCDTSALAFGLTLPLSATLGDTINILDLAGTFNAYYLTVNRNGHNIQRVADNLCLDNNNTFCTLIYTNVANGWLVIAQTVT